MLTWINALGTEIIPPDYPTLFFFERGEWWDYAMLLAVTAGLAFASWLTVRYRWAVLLLLVATPLCLTIFWWPHSTAGTASAGWFPVVKQYSALAGSLCLVALQIFPKLRRNKWYLLIPPLILAVNILEAVIRDFQCFSLQGIDPTQGMVTWGGPWNIMNGIAGILNLLMISGWIGITVSRKADKRIIWLDLTIWWIIAYDLWNLAYCYNCLADRSWYSGVALLASCTIPALLSIGRGAWIQYRAYTLTFWSAIVLTFPHFMQDSIFAHRSAHNPSAMFLISFLALVANVLLAVYHVYRIVKLRRNPLRQEIYADAPYSQAIITEHLSQEAAHRIQDRLKKNSHSLRQ